MDLATLTEAQWWARFEAAFQPFLSIPDPLARLEAMDADAVCGPLLREGHRRALQVAA